MWEPYIKQNTTGWNAYIKDEATNQIRNVEINGRAYHYSDNHCFWFKWTARRAARLAAAHSNIRDYSQMEKV